MLFIYRGFIFKDILQTNWFWEVSCTKWNIQNAIWLLKSNFIKQDRNKRYDLYCIWIPLVQYFCFLGLGPCFSLSWTEDSFMTYLARTTCTLLDPCISSSHLDSSSSALFWVSSKFLKLTGELPYPNLHCRHTPVTRANTLNWSV